MIQQMKECGTPLSMTDIDELERSLGIALPNDYRAFLLKYNGGRPTPNGFPIEGLKGNPMGSIQVFFGIGSPIESCNLDWNYATHNGRVPTNLFPIACDDGGDLVCLSLYGKDAGAVVFWDYFNEPDEPSYQNAYHIAGSLAEFLESIHTLPY